MQSSVVLAHTIFTVWKASTKIYQRRRGFISQVDLQAVHVSFLRPSGEAVGLRKMSSLHKSSEEAGKICHEKLVESVRKIWQNDWKLGNEQEARSSDRVALVLSGGVDTCAVVSALRECGFQVDLALTVYCDPTATDRPYAPAIAKEWGVEHIEIECSKEELLADPLRLCVESLTSFDPMQIRNSMVVARALMEAKSRGVRYVLTGDGSDELMGGYSFSWNTEDPVWSQKRYEMCSDWFFSATSLGESLGLDVKSPYTEAIFKDWALSSLDKALCIGERELETKPGEQRILHRTGKLPLRDAFPDAFSAWRRKDPIEVGSGATILGANEGKYFSSLISADELLKEKERILHEDHLIIRNPEHLYYYRVFRKAFPSLSDNNSRLPRRGSRGDEGCCIACHFQLSRPTSDFCRVCGQWPARRKSTSVELDV